MSQPSEISEEFIFKKIQVQVQFEINNVKTLREEKKCGKKRCN